MIPPRVRPRRTRPGRSAGVKAHSGAPSGSGGSAATPTGRTSSGGTPPPPYAAFSDPPRRRPSPTDPRGGPGPSRPAARGRRCRPARAASRAVIGETCLGGSVAAEVSDRLRRAAAGTVSVAVLHLGTFSNLTSLLGHPLPITRRRANLEALLAVPREAIRHPLIMPNSVEGFNSPPSGHCFWSAESDIYVTGRPSVHTTGQIPRHSLRALRRFRPELRRRRR